MTVVELATCQCQIKHNKQSLNQATVLFVQECRKYEDSCRFQERRQGRTGTGDGERIGTGAGGRRLYSGPKLLVGGVSTRAGIGDGPTCGNRLTSQWRIVFSQRLGRRLRRLSVAS